VKGSEIRRSKGDSKRPPEWRADTSFNHSKWGWCQDVCAYYAILLELGKRKIAWNAKKVKNEGEIGLGWVWGDLVKELKILYGIAARHRLRGPNEE
jgi:hypothetical protein